jgi:CBS domain-containing protein
MNRSATATHRVNRILRATNDVSRFSDARYQSTTAGGGLAGGLRQDTRTAADVMVRDVITAEEQTTLPLLAELMINHGIKRLPVLRDGKVVVIVSRADLVTAIARSPVMLL